MDSPPSVKATGNPKRINMNIKKKSMSAKISIKKWIDRFEIGFMIDNVNQFVFILSLFIRVYQACWSISL